MEELRIIEAVINKALSKGVFESCNEIAQVLQTLQSLGQKIKNFENGSNNTTDM